MKTYAGIGSRETPNNILTLMTNLGTKLAEHGWTLNSGGAIGADKAFEKGARIGNGKYNIFYAKDATSESITLASKYHPAWHKCNTYVQKLHARNGMIVLNYSLQEPVNFIICWTSNGEITGGTGQALRLAKDYDIMVFNLALPNSFNNLYQYLTSYEQNI
jgi:hypothetical protein